MYRVFCLKSFAMTWGDNEQHMFGDKKKKPATETMIVICYEMIHHHELLSK